MRDSAAAAAQQIAANDDLPAAQKKQALAELAAATREQVRARLGAEDDMGWPEGRGAHNLTTDDDD